MSLSAKKNQNTTLQNEAANIVNEDSEDEVEVTDEAKYEAMMGARKDRRAVILQFN